jgi:hypothetical protein
MDKYSSAEVGAIFQMGSAGLRKLSEDNQELREKVAAYEKKELAEKIAEDMDAKGLQPELSTKEKVAGLLEKDNLDVIQEAVGLTAPQTKFASVADDGKVPVEGGDSDTETGRADAEFAAKLASI